MLATLKPRSMNQCSVRVVSTKRRLTPARRAVVLYTLHQLLAAARLPVAVVRMDGQAGQLRHLVGIAVEGGATDDDACRAP